MITDEATPATRPEIDPNPITIFHNPKCSKSRGAVELVEAQGTTFRVIEYLKAPPDRATLDHIARRYPGPVADLVRTGDTAFLELDIDRATLTTVDAVVEVLLGHPEVMQRPIVVRGDAVVIARPSELVAGLLD
ncbi:MAG TPA: ArsC/Spx/MgsR family protein [Acidimicrobiales bacterium]|jgi:arsenate reductase|nr:ArsC/Spx/MgsR family protein [Acidimicrobiales bacterium]